MQIERETSIAAPVERVWAVLTQAEHVGRWFGDAGAEIDLRPGGEMVVRWAEYGVGRMRVVDVEPPRRFSYRWAPVREHWGEDPTEGTATLVEFTLDATDEQRRRSVDDNTEGWEKQLDNVREYAGRVTA